MRRNQNIGICPHCGSEVVAREKGWMLMDLSLWRISIQALQIRMRLILLQARKMARNGDRSLCTMVSVIFRL